MMGEGGQACELDVDGLGECEGVEGGPEVLGVGHPHWHSLGAGLDAIERGLGAIVDTADPGPHPGFADERHGRQEQVLEEPEFLSVERVQGGHSLGRVVPDVPHELSDVGPVLLFDVGVVVFLVGPAPRELDPVVLAVADEVGVDELRAIVGVDALSDFLSECFNQLRRQSRVNLLQGRVQFGGALSGRDVNAAQKTISGLLKLLYPSAATPVPDEAMEWAVGLALESRRRVKEQQKWIGAAEFRNTHFSYQLGLDGVERFVSTPELQREDSIGADPLPPGQVWAISPGGLDENSALYRIETVEGPGSGIKILNQPAPGPFKESVRCAEQNLYGRAKQLVGDRDPREHEFSVQLRAFDAARTGSALGVGVLLSLCCSLLQKSLKAGLVVVGGLNLGGSVDLVYNAVSVAELAIDKGATALLMPVSARKQLLELPDDLATKVDIQFYTDAREALLKALID